MVKIAAFALLAALAACAAEPSFQSVPTLSASSGTRAQPAAFRTQAPGTSSMDESPNPASRPQRLVVTESPGSLRQIVTLQQYRGGERLTYQVVDLPGTPSEGVRMETHVVLPGTTSEGGYSTLTTDGNTYRRHDQRSNLLAYRDFNSNTMMVRPARTIVPALPINLEGPVPDLQPFSFPHRSFPSFSYNFAPTITGIQSIRLCVVDKCYETIRINVLLTDRASMQIHHETVWLAEGIGIVMWRFRSTFARGIEADRILVNCTRDGVVCAEFSGSNQM